jgi:hypothetical protein
MNGERKLQSAKRKAGPWERDAVIEDKSGKHREEKHQNLRDRFLQLGIRMIRSGMALPETRLAGVCAEADELISIAVKSLKTARGAFHVAKS